MNFSFFPGWFLTSVVHYRKHAYMVSWRPNWFMYTVWSNSRYAQKLILIKALFRLIKRKPQIIYSNTFLTRYFFLILLIVASKLVYNFVQYPDFCLNADVFWMRFILRLIAIQPKIWLLDKQSIGQRISDYLLSRELKLSMKRMFIS